ncbi:DUF4440 domain-containing protein [Pseudohongiella sp.]|uniref:nuclear transport factor 2 family protein n=1 Tax=Pseudohongiella sp. TaxID=1979412 RepID=UPI0034A085A9
MLDELVRLERELHDPSVRKSAERLNQLLHDSFVEIGRSGKVYDKAGILSSLESEPTQMVWSQDYETHIISDRLVLLIYRSAHIGSDDLLSRFSRRSSFWEKVGNTWKLRYHQGTPTSAFEPSAS